MGSAALFFVAGDGVGPDDRRNAVAGCATEGKKKSARMFTTSPF